MNFIIINHYATTPYFNGGTRHYDLAKELIDKGHTVTIIASSYNHFMKQETQIYKNNSYKEEVIDNVNFVWLKTIPYKNSTMRMMNIISFYIQGRKYIKNIKNLPAETVVIGSTVHLLGAQLGLDLAKGKKLKFVFEERDFWPQTFVDFGKLKEQSLVAKLLYKYEKYFYNNAEKVIVLFPKAHNYLISKNVSKDKIIYLPNGYSEKSNIDQNISHKLQESLSGNTITYIGSHGLANELDTILDFAKICTELDAKFIFIGEGALKESLKNRVLEEGLKSVLFFDSINKNQVQYVLEQSKFSIISIKDSPLYKYGFSMNKIYDYLKVGNPVFMIASEELAEEYNIEGISVGLDLEKHKNKLVEYLYDEEIYKNDKENVKKFSRKFSWEKISEEFLDKLK